MKQWKNYESTKTYTDSVKIPSGGYIGVIKKAEVKSFNGQNGAYEQLHISFDITEGEFKDYYANNYRNQQTEDKKWKGVFRYTIPTDDGSEYDEGNKRKLKTALESIEESNNGYHWNWDENTLKGKAIGIILQNKEWEFNGNSGWSAQPYCITTVEKIKSGKFKVPADKPLNNKTSAPAKADNLDFEPIDDDDLPF